MQPFSYTPLANSNLEVFKIASLEDFREANSESEEGLLILMTPESQVYGLDTVICGKSMTFFKNQQTFLEYVNTVETNMMAKIILLLAGEMRVLRTDGLDAIFNASQQSEAPLFYVRQIVDSPTALQQAAAPLN